MKEEELSIKKKWETPRMYIEEFAPNEYVSHCMYLECAIPGKDPFKGNDYTGSRLFDFQVESWGEITGISPDYQEHGGCAIDTRTTWNPETGRGFGWTFISGKGDVINRDVQVYDFQMGGTNPADWNKQCAVWKTKENGVVFQHYGYCRAADVANRS